MKSFVVGYNPVVTDFFMPDFSKELQITAEFCHEYPIIAFCKHIPRLSERNSTNLTRYVV
ncbi:hypothetical protein SOPP22_03640 [Shewanella sp. OPT22]|nr:hypothetical protein SOPP22_03640 [Shewanella sp. OPT22]